MWEMHIIYLLFVSCCCFMQVTKGMDIEEKKGVDFVRPKVYVNEKKIFVPFRCFWTYAWFVLAKGQVEILWDHRNRKQYFFFGEHVP